MDGAPPRGYRRPGRACARASSRGHKAAVRAVCLSWWRCVRQMMRKRALVRAYRYRWSFSPVPAGGLSASHLPFPSKSLARLCFSAVAPICSKLSHPVCASFASSFCLNGGAGRRWRARDVDRGASLQLQGTLPTRSAVSASLTRGGLRRRWCLHQQASLWTWSRRWPRRVKSYAE